MFVEIEANEKRKIVKKNARPADAEPTRAENKRIIISLKLKVNSQLHLPMGVGELKVCREVFWNPS